MIENVGVSGSGDALRELGRFRAVTSDNVVISEIRHRGRRVRHALVVASEPITTAKAQQLWNEFRNVGTVR
jgi:hypothetical protein